MHESSPVIRLPGGEKTRYLLAGGFNTALTLGIYWLLLFIDVRYIFAYSVSFVLGIFTSYALNTYLVFYRSWSWRKLSIFPSVHLVNYLIGTIVVWTWVSLFHFDAKTAPIVATLLIIPASFIMTRKLIKHEPKPIEADDEPLDR